MKSEIKNSLKWALPLAVITLVLAAIFSIIATAVLSRVGVIGGITVILAIILIALFFDIVGVAATASSETPFHSMASKGLSGAKYAVWLTKNADRVNTFCTDVIGDINAILSGTAVSVVVTEMVILLSDTNKKLNEYVISVVLTCIVAALTVFVKALGKTFAINNATKIIYNAGYVIYFAENHLHIPIMSFMNNKKHGRARKRKDKKGV
ncbi:hypothetical protein [Sporolactobacillus putidus]|uniref:Uncharacterized protein n=1 Tax=Sporolactobacillus putidus TaxID=492735 RepID=A0A917S3S6_9BACL|nr:hypothetical protein [Sporolactobacillus putidus]GGL55533.1 hypothetical protein GCM10007968_19620 [Sporolactobacillus putidus]